MKQKVLSFFVEWLLSEEDALSLKCCRPEKMHLHCPGVVYDNTNDIYRKERV